MRSKDKVEPLLPSNHNQFLPHLCRTWNGPSDYPSLAFWKLPLTKPNLAAICQIFSTEWVFLKFGESKLAFISNVHSLFYQHIRYVLWLRWLHAWASYKATKASLELRVKTPLVYFTKYCESWLFCMCALCIVTVSFRYCVHSCAFQYLG